MERPRWPDGLQSCVALAFDVDGPTGSAMLDGSIWRNPSFFTLGAFGPWRALGYLLDLLDELLIPPSSSAGTRWATTATSTKPSGSSAATSSAR
jgi:hypothetical protein